MDVGTRLFTWMNGKLVGEDAYGNKYYVHKKGVLRDGHEMRWCMYKGLVEASKVPPEWHHWLHHGTDQVPDGKDPRQFAWQKEHQPNLTGTPYAYRPPGHVLEGGKRDKATGDYEPWTPA
ncbi:MAG: NADH:ubiquinone oxidoreductase subunit NDUFA12 [Alphaproteobacteria bacterium]|nr:NADH:ubiquinone oxidoreductase subunit NDUFA12 [Alphaproteobacteria bacterium]